MSLSTRLIVQGKVAAVTSRTITTKAGDELTFTNVILIGDNCLADVQLGRGMVAPEIGALVAGVVEVGVYRDDDQHVLQSYLEPSKGF